MSSIQFHTNDGVVAKVHGSQRALASEITVRATMETLDATNSGRVFALIREGVLPAGVLDYTTLGYTPLDGLQTWLRDFLGMAEVEIEGTTSPVMHAVLNTAAVQGSDAVAFLARLHGSVENRIWVDTANLPWFADLLGEVSVLSADEGWRTAADSLATATSPVVISSSQGADFPGYIYDEETDEELGERTWDAALAQVQDAGWWLQVSPDNLHEPAYTPLFAFPTQNARTDA